VSNTFQVCLSAFSRLWVLLFLSCEAHRYQATYKQSLFFGAGSSLNVAQLMVLFDDGSLRGYALTPSGLQMIWPAAFMLPGEQHPF
jgi:hypothetical protein